MRKRKSKIFNFQGVTLEVKTAFLTMLVLPTFLVLTQLCFGHPGLMLMAILFTAIIMIGLAYFCRQKQKQFIDEAERSLAFRKLKSVNVISLLLFLLLISSVVFQVVLGVELNQYPPSFASIEKYVKFYTNLVYLLPNIINALTIALFVLQTLYPISILKSAKKS
ncbi:hypothetical protein [Photobacterium damselae]|uniref:Uncharacterized protein n=1 Tax=Photobacterium damselae subsp. damselae TaxID=85581 RepID=A0AAD3WYS2_PHODD|nr:hypothetical protein [Photobacterium damselae]AWK84615.1 hypothetical protein BST98_21550 [Photobacterium damselae]KAB1185690.1 hypothetical protein F6450_00945 [Photobacterium damselae subsp. damselae]PSB85316.1 hypothetical protein C5F64_12520 [Photobacterium damselae subsp. damselae]TLS84336.1 hypothetical protein FD720_17455 [Photobacterium damselae subsp. damselae]